MRINGDVIYDDGLVLLDEAGVTLRYYYFPVATKKFVPYDRIRAVDTRPRQLERAVAAVGRIVDRSVASAGRDASQEGHCSGVDYPPHLAGIHPRRS
jgi:hypothetical protein